MILNDLIRSDVQKFIRDNERTPIDKLIFKGSPFPEISILALAQQVDARLRTQKKLPLWFKTENILYPPKLNLEQTSSEITALYKSKLIHGEVVLDATGGFGVDSFYFSQSSEKVIHIEINKELSELATYNFRVLGAHKVKTIHGDALDHLQKTTKRYDVIFIDPARRSNTNSKLFLLKDCTPDILQHLDLLLNSCTDLWIKTAPLLDISSGLRALKNVVSIHIIAVKNEVKELLWQLNNTTHQEDVPIVAVNLDTSQSQQDLRLSEIRNAQAVYGLPQIYLYEPNAALLKSGSFNWISSHFSLLKLHEHSHLYTSLHLRDFPGRRFKINVVLPYSKRIKTELSISKAHITTRNFRLTVATLRKQLQIKEGGDTYLFFTTQRDHKSIVLVCSKC